MYDHDDFDYGDYLLNIPTIQPSSSMDVFDHLDGINKCYDMFFEVDVVPE